MTERRMDPRRARTRKAVLDAAEQAFAARGERTSVDDIYDLAGVSMATIYAVFGSKDGIAQAVGERALESSPEKPSSNGSRSTAETSDALLGLAATQPVGVRALTRRAMAAGEGDADEAPALEGTPDWDTIMGELPATLRRELRLSGDEAASAHALLLVTSWHALAGLLARRDSGEIPARLAEQTFELGRAALATALGSALEDARERDSGNAPAERSGP